MTVTRQDSYDYPPIREAIFSVVFDEALSLDDLDRFCELSFLGEDYEGGEEILKVEVKSGEREEVPRKTVERNGQKWQSKNGATRLQITRTFLSFHRIKEYHTWEDLQDRFLYALRQLQQTIAGCNCSDLSVRTINHIRIPGAAREDVADYLPLFVTVPDNDFPTDLDQFFIQLQFMDKTGTLRGIVTESRLPSDKPDELAILLDITVIRPGSFNSDSRETEFQMMPVRDFKNQLFESCITDKVRIHFTKAPQQS